MLDDYDFLNTSVMCQKNDWLKTKIKKLDGCKYVTYMVRADFNYLFFVGNGFMFSHQKSHRTIFHKKKHVLLKINYGTEHKKNWKSIKNQW